LGALNPVLKGNGKKMKRFVIQIVFIMMIASTPSFADVYELELAASCSDLEARYRADLPLGKGMLSTGLGALYRNADYKIADMKLALGKELWAHGLRIQVGLKGVLGELERDQKKGDLSAVGIMVSARYPFPQTISTLPLGISAGASFSPEPFCFWDASRYIDLRTSLDFRVTNNGAILLGYRFIRTRFEDNREKWNISDERIFVGYRLRY
jgi:hypothetical protein